MFASVALTPVTSAYLVSCELVEGIGSISYAGAGGESARVEAGAESARVDAEGGGSDIYDAGPVDETTMCSREAAVATSSPRSFPIDASRLLAHPVHGAGSELACVEDREVTGGQYDQFLDAAAKLLSAYATSYASSSACGAPGRCTYDVVSVNGFLTPGAKTEPTMPVTGVAPCAAELYCWSINRGLCPREEWTNACMTSATEPDFSPVGLELSIDTDCSASEPNCVTSCLVMGTDESCVGQVPCHTEMQDVAFRCWAPDPVADTCTP